MFNKPILNNRNDVITRKEVNNVLGSTTPLKTSATETNPAPATAAAAPVAQPEKAESLAENVMGARLIVGPDVKLKGAEILDCDTLVVEGRVEATMDSRVIRIAENGSFSGKVSIDIAEIHGCFEGELTARSQLIIHATGKVTGKIRYGKLVIDEGGELCGDINALSAEKATPFHLRDEPVKSLSAIAG
ncbi:bactofilin family protein [Ferribacterium limneticum]|uniref:bactofilin family protein n=1 Tax=Ferribacterium limneticum TaxID=76259 RepID=UPI001CF82984|nr:polymer-forming cytoskeletal protein [Ferribacterium limneticum]UCV21230.1 polymer-forming cytoskeletal protein [Ferribacterium limneticum]